MSDGHFATENFIEHKNSYKYVFCMSEVMSELFSSIKEIGILYISLEFMIITNVRPT